MGPFPLGGTAQPAPIVYAKHYAESFSQSILSSDKSLKSLRVNKNFHNRPQVIAENIISKQQQQQEEQIKAERANKKANEKVKTVVVQQPMPSAPAVSNEHAEGELANAMKSMKI